MLQVGICFRLQHTNEGDAAVVLIEIHAIAHDELVRAVEAVEVDLDIDLAALLLI